MRRYADNSVSQYTLIIFLGVALLFGQAFKFHMHIQHDGIPASSSGHIIDVHTAASLHDTTHDTHHQDGIQDHHHPTEIDISSESLVKKVGLSSLSMLLFLVVIILCASRLRCIHGWHILKTTPVSLNYLLHPPLRAPPM